MGVFGSSGVRGVVNEDLTPAFVERLCAVVGAEWELDRVAIGRDTRLSGPLFESAAAAGFMSAGVDVGRVGVIPTPGLQDHLRREEIAGCMVTASHNPREYNGLKFFDATGRELSGAGIERIEQAMSSDDRRRAHWDRVGSEDQVTGVRELYIDGIVDAVDAEAIRDHELTVAIDPGHGAASTTSPRLCRELGCRVVTVNATPDGRFPSRSPEPVPGVLEDLQRLVRASDADVGVAHDGDGDRAMFVDETGAVIDGDTMLAVLATALVEVGDVVVTAVNASQGIEDAVHTAGGTIERTAIGSAQILERIAEVEQRGERVPLAGESNGGLFLPEERSARDGAFVLARVLSFVGESPLSERTAAHSKYHMEKRALRYASIEERARMLEAIEDLARTTDAPVDRTDGVRIDFEKGWVLARPSGTEPLVRLTAEADSRERTRALLDRMLSAIDRVN